MGARLSVALLDWPIFGLHISCPICRRQSPALMLTEAYLCPSHGAFEADPVKGALVHLDTERCWYPWQGNWYQQHRDPEGLKIEVYQALDHLHYQGFRAVKLTLAHRYEALVQPHLEFQSDWWRQIYYAKPRLYGLPLEFSPAIDADSRWQVINFEFSTEFGPPAYAHPFCTRWDEGFGKSI